MRGSFGASASREGQLVKFRWLIGAVSAVIVVLSITFIVLLATSEEDTEANATKVEPIAQEPKSTTGDNKVLIARQRIEEGALLKPEMFSAQTLPSGLVPDEALTAADRSQMTGKFAMRLINAKSVVSYNDITEVRPVSALNIPPGFRAVSIEVTARSGVEGFAKPNSRVDISWVFEHNNMKRVATIVRFAKVLSIDGSTRVDGATAIVGGKVATVTLLVSERNAKIIELARTTGELSLSLVGEEEDINIPGQRDSVSMKDLLRKIYAEEGIEKEPDYSGVVWTTSPRTGRQLKFVLNNRRWKMDEGAKKKLKVDYFAEPKPREVRKPPVQNRQAKKPLLVPGAQRAMIK